ncbi:NAD(P)/FAD-dependent oxidoreductase [Profundibacterium mesophilum]|uniref:Dihydrolipoamide dehydrogenase n=1 Tax=Profundibacterium mesophilum KAUST100406-0324 TaxID=1037889 RepID=A0A921NTV5_9RHOB|nr:aminoacetone oxidase family FAD-binding enzyme [Profundibacterium mesophilum]KAF0675453.1 dihydrolipoamide dehydrogenase [Profundibacterium mesophilum KAUST100406-0324]
MQDEFDTVILGAGAAGMMCAAHAGGRVLVIDHARAPGEKIRISGGGRCNFTNTGCGPENFLSANPHFAKSALSRYGPWDFLDLVQRHKIAWHEKTLGQLFCDGSARQIVEMLLAEMRGAGAELWLRAEPGAITHGPDGFAIDVDREGQRRRVSCRNLVLATGGKSIPKMGASGLSYRIAEQFGLSLRSTRPGLVPLTFGLADLDWITPMAGVAAPARVTAGQGPGTASFEEALLFTHRGLSGPAILQASSYWNETATVTIDLDPAGAVLPMLRGARAKTGRKTVPTLLSGPLPARLAAHLAAAAGVEGRVGDLPDAALTRLEDILRRRKLIPSGTEGYRTAEVTLGGIDTDGLDSRSLRARAMPGLYAIGEAVDVTGWLGGYNFQWAWASGYAAGTAIAAGTARRGA